MAAQSDDGVWDGPCPECGGSSRPYRAATLNADQLEVAMRCSGCRNEWRVTVDNGASPAFLTPDLIDDPRR